MLSLLSLAVQVGWHVLESLQLCHIIEIFFFNLTLFECPKLHKNSNDVRTIAGNQLHYFQ